MQASERDRAPLAAAASFDHRVERDQRLREIAGISRDAVGSSLPAPHEPD